MNKNQSCENVNFEKSIKFIGGVILYIYQKDK